MRYQAHFGNKTFENRHVCLVDCSFISFAGGMLVFALFFLRQAAPFLRSCCAGHLE